MDVLGVNQHHDAITGTAKQFVANDYAHSVYDGLMYSLRSHTTVLKNVSSTHFGLTANEYQQCTLTNGTYLDCPIASWKNDTEILVAIHNPQTFKNDTQWTKIKVPHGNIKVEKYDKGEFKSLDYNATVFCYPNLMENGMWARDCDLWMRLGNATGLNHVKISYDQGNSIAVTPLDDDTISSDTWSLQVVAHQNGTHLLYNYFNETNQTANF